jgi:hypothetical protein
MGLGDDAVQKNLIGLYGTSEWVSKAWIGPILALAVLAAVAFTREKWNALSAETPVR